MINRLLKLVSPISFMHFFSSPTTTVDDLANDLEESVICLGEDDVSIVVIEDSILDATTDSSLPTKSSSLAPTPQISSTPTPVSSAPPPVSATPDTPVPSVPPPKVVNTYVGKEITPQITVGKTLKTNGEIIWRGGGCCVVALYYVYCIYYRFIVRFPIGLDFPFITIPFQGC